MRPIKVIVTTALFVMLALVGPRAEAQNGSDSSSDESTRAASSSNGGEVESGSSRDSNLESRWPPSQFKSLNSQELDEHYDKSGLDKHYDKSGLDEHYVKSGLDEH
jgi:hypothetical protein